MADHETKIKLIEDADATESRPGLRRVAREIRTAKDAGYLEVLQSSARFPARRDEIRDTVHFSHGHLDRRTKEAIASWVSWLNRCPY